MGCLAATTAIFGANLVIAQTPLTGTGGSPSVSGSTSSVTRQLLTPTRPHPLPAPDASKKSGAQYLSANAGLVYLTDGNPQLVGYGFTFDPQTGDWKVKQPAAPITLDQNYVLDSFIVDFFGSSVSESLSSSSALAVNVSAAYGLVKAAAQMAQQESASSSQFANEFSLVIKKQYQPKMLDLAQAASLVYLPTAQQILAIQDPAERVLQWKNTFGEYLAIGFDVRAYAGLKVSLTQTESSSSKSTYFALQAQYKTLAGSGASGGVSFASMAKQALETSGINLSLKYEGSVEPVISIPTSVSQIDEPSEQQMLVDALYDALLNSYAKRGLILIPWSAIPGAPVFDINSFAGPAAGEAAFVAKSSIELLEQARRWSYPMALQTFLDNRLMPNSTVSYGTKLDETRTALIDTLNDLWLKLVAHGVAPTAQSSDDLLVAAAAVKTAQGVGSAYGLSDMLVDLEAMAATFPPMQILVQENATPSPNPQPTDISPVHYMITIKNVGFFSSWVYATPWIKAYDAFTDTGSIVMYEDAIIQGSTQYLQPSTFANGQLKTPIMMSKVPSTTLGCEGLYDIKFLLMTDDWAGTKWIHLKSTDDLGRSVHLMYDRALDNPF